MRVYIKNPQKISPIRSQQIKNQIRKVLKHENLEGAELSIVFVNDEKIKNLNRKFLSRDYPTDVLAFDLTNRYQPSSRENFLGEIVISTDTAKRNAKTYNTSFRQEIKLYIIHGILHLLGYKDKTKNEKELMYKKEKELSEILK